MYCHVFFEVPTGFTFRVLTALLSMTSMLFISLLAVDPHQDNGRACRMKKSNCEEVIPMFRYAENHVMMLQG